jgi:uncharacterized protein
MLQPAILVLLAVMAVGTSFLSGIFGMAGGLILLGVLLAILDVAPAMMLFGATQLAANGWRTVLWRGYIAWPIVLRFVSGSLVCFFFFRLIAIVPDKAALYLLMGLIPLVAYMLPERLMPSIVKPGVPFLCGMFITVLQLLSGGAGTILDMFFQKSALDRKTVVATKASTQVVGHLLRIAYFGALAPGEAQVPWWMYGAMIGFAILGTSLAANVLHTMSDASFRVWSKRIILAVSATYIARGLWLLVR